MAQNLPGWNSPEINSHCSIIAQCYKHWTGKPILPEIDKVLWPAEALYHAPFVIVSHGTGPDPIFNYANITAQQLWQFSWDEFTSLPSRKSAEPMEESKRKLHLEDAKNKGIVYLEKGVRVNKNGQRFYIKDVALFTLFSQDKFFLGQCAVFQQWEYL